MVRPILIVDSDQNVADAIGRVLRSAAFNSAIFYDHESALLYVGANSPALALAEANAPEHYDFLRGLRLKSPATPAILMAGREVEDFPRRAMQAGAAGYLLKPFSNAELIASVRTHLRAR